MALGCTKTLSGWIRHCTPNDAVDFKYLFLGSPYFSFQFETAVLTLHGWFSTLLNVWTIGVSANTTHPSVGDCNVRLKK